MKCFLFMAFSCLFLQGCMMRTVKYYPPAPAFKTKYSDKLSPDATLVDWGYIYTLERTAAGKYHYQQFWPETRQLVISQTFLDQSMTIAHGPSKTWWDDGTPSSEGNYENGKKVGDWINWSWKNKSMGKYLNDQQNGLWVETDSLGNKRSEITFSAGKRNGPFKDWNATGELVREGTYVNNKIEIEKQYLEDHSERSVFKSVEKRPNFPGCTMGPDEERNKCADAKMLQFIFSNIKYPPFARENGIQGTALVRFVVEKDGSISSIKTLRGVCPEIKYECERVVQMMPPWEPGMQNGKPVRVFFNLPVKFKLQ